MALLFCDGFDSYTTTDDMRVKWGQPNSYKSVYTNLNTFDSTGGRWGGGALLCKNFLTPFTKALTPAGPTTYFNFAFKPTSMPYLVTQALCSLGDSNINDLYLGKAYLAVNANGYIVASARRNDGVYDGFAGPGPSQIRLNEWNTISAEFTCADIAGGRWICYLNGVLQFDVTGDTLISGTANTTNFNFYSLYRDGFEPPAGPWSIWYDDVVIYDNNGASMNALITTDYKIRVIRPTSDGGTLQWTPTPAGTHYTAVDDSGTVDWANVVAGASTGDRDLYGLANLSPQPTTVHAAVVNAVARKTDVGSKNLKLLIQQNAVDSVSADIALENGGMNYQHPVYQNPDGPSSWTSATIDAALVGVQVGT